MARKRFDTGSRKRFDTGEGNLDMIKNSVTAIKHHAEELTMELKKNPDIEAWVLAKVDRAAQNLSDVTHYLDGEMNKFVDGGYMKKGGINEIDMDLMEKTDDELLTNDELLAENIKEAKRNKVKITNLGWNQGKDYIVSKTTQRKDGSNILTSFINFNHAWDSY